MLTFQKPLTKCYETWVGRFLVKNDVGYYCLSTQIFAKVSKCPIVILDTSAPVPKCLGSEVSVHGIPSVSAVGKYRYCVGILATLGLGLVLVLVSA